MKNYIPVYPILPTSEASTLSFVQKLAVLEYRLEKLDERVAALETEIPDIPNISITNGEDDRIEKITLNNVDYYPDEVIIEGTGSSLTAVTVNGETLTAENNENVVDGYFAESSKQSAPYFDLQIDGISLLNTVF